MANPDHVKILKQGVEIWNQWRISTLNIRPDLNDTNFSDTNLTGANLSGANLSGANLKEAFLSRANLMKANLSGTNLRNANLSSTDLREAVLSSASLREANLTGANLRHANLSGTNLSGTNLSGTNLSGANLRHANLSGTNLSGANLSGANLSAADLTDADLRLAVLHLADLRSANLRNTKLTNAKLFATSRDSWRIEGVKCDYVCWGIDEERTPRDRDFLPGEFEELYKWRPLGDFEKLIKRAIEFPAEYKQAGTSILNYFSEILHKKYPEANATVQIKQDGLKVSMIVDPVDGEREIIEKVLNEYGLVVTGRMTPEEFCNNPFEAMELKNKLALAELEVRQTKELLQISGKNYEQRIASLEDDVQWLRSHVGDVLQSSRKTDEIHIHSNGDVSVAKDQAKADIIKDANVGIVGDKAKSEGGIHFNNNED